jgi:hypothetical protein
VAAHQADPAPPLARRQVAPFEETEMKPRGVYQYRLQRPDGRWTTWSDINKKAFEAMKHQPRAGLLVPIQIRELSIIKTHSLNPLTS